MGSYKPFSHHTFANLLTDEHMSEENITTIKKKLDRLLTFHIEPDSQPIDYYRCLGRTIIKLQLVTEINNLIFSIIKPDSRLRLWVVELYDIKKSCDKNIETINEIIMTQIVIEGKALPGYV
jgi:hypothetical protein